MNLLEALNHKKYTIEELTRIYYNGIMKGIEKYQAFQKNSEEHSEMEGEITEEKFDLFQQSENSVLDITFDEFKQLMEIKKPEAITAITNLALVRRLAFDMCEKDVTLFITQHGARQMAEMEKQNDRNYAYLEQLGYSGQKDEKIPSIVSENFLLYQEKEHLKKEILILMDSENRMEYYLQEHKKNSKVCETKEVLEAIFEGYPLKHIRKKLGLEEDTLKELREKQNDAEIALQQEDIKRLKKAPLDYSLRAGKIADEMEKGKIDISMQMFEELHSLGFEYTNERESPIVRSGFKEYMDVKVLKDLRRKVWKETLKLYGDICRIPKADQFICGKEKMANPDPVAEFWNFVEKPIVESKVKKGKMSEADLERVLNAIEKEEDTHRLRLPKSLTRGVRMEELEK